MGCFPGNFEEGERSINQVVADVWETDVWEFQAMSGSSGSCRLFLHFLGKRAVQKISGKTLASPRHPSSRHPRPSELRHVGRGPIKLGKRPIKDRKRPSNANGQFSGTPPSQRALRSKNFNPDRKLQLEGKELGP